MTPRPRHEPSALPKTARIPPHAVGAWQALTAALRRTVPPCAGEPAAFYADAPAARQEAAQACSTCPVLRPCGDYADAAGEPGGVWAGIDRTQPAATARRVS